MHPEPTTTPAPSKRKGKPKTRPKRGRPRGTVKAPRQTVQARILTTTAVWLRRQHPTARTLHHAAAQALDLLAQQNASAELPPPSGSASTQGAVGG